MSISSQRRRSRASYQPGSAGALAQRLADELALRWSEGERPETEDYLARFPQLAGDPEAALELIYEEMCQQRRAGQRATASTWLRRFPQWRPQLEMLLACHSLLENANAKPWFPDPGSEFGEFQLLAQLGHGAHGRVYLARQPSLADRPVVLKLASLAGQEHLSLARLQHTYIMPLYWAQDDAAVGLRALCMPYFGGASLSQLLNRLEDVPAAKRTGRDLLQALAAEGEGQRLAPPVRGPACRIMEKASYVEAICTIGACLAEAIDYAHQRNVVHHDLKPSNVLIAADGQPLLLDFHLAQPSLEAGTTHVRWLGGTPDYMAPEQEAALEAIERQQPIPRRVDGQADLYTLGLLLCEALAGQHPPSAEPPARWLRGKNSQVSAALGDVIAKCMAPDADQRYPSAGALAIDLRRHLANQPLKHITNRSLSERWAKWRRRRPYALTGIFLCLALLTSCVVTATTLRQRWEEAERALEEAQAEMEAGHFQWAKLTIDRGLSLAAELPWRGKLVRDLQIAETVAQQGYLVEQLHAVVEQLRGWYGADGLPAAEAMRLETDGRRLWDQRKLLIAHVAARHWSETQVKHDLIDLAVFWADFHWRYAPEKSRVQAAQQALEALMDAERLAGARFVLCREQQRFARLVGDEPAAARAAQKAESLSPASAWEHYALGRSAFSEGKIEQADAHFRAAVDLNPRELWPNFYHGRASYELNRFEEAATAFTVCIALARRSWCYYNRGLANLRLERPDRARDDFNRALEVDRHLAVAALERGMLSYREKRYDEALADLRLAAAEKADPKSVAYGRALIYAAKGDRADALGQLDELFVLQSDHEEGRKLARALGATANESARQ
jgi:eukaryotic-like serine/threonine-protein kinase